jgi:hypothetical protein
MASGICSKWNQPIFFNNDTTMTGGLLSYIIVKVENAGYKVTSIVHDFDTQNQSLWKSLSVSIDTPYFNNPFDPSRKIWTFADAPHMLKLVRNHLLDQGFVLADGTLIDKKILQAILDFDSSECRKLTPNLLDVSGAERMKVAPAAQLLSSHTAAISKFLFPESPKVSEFFKGMDDWFDIFNSHVSEDRDKPIRGAYGLQLQKQNKRLDEIEFMVKNMRCRLYSKKENQMLPRKNLIPCQLGILTSINALKGLFADVSKRYGVTYIKTRRLNQDSLESHFSEVRSLGRTADAPNAVAFRDREKLLLLGTKCVPPISANVDVTKVDLNYISRKLLDSSATLDIIDKAQVPTQCLQTEIEEEEEMDVPITPTATEANDTCSKAALFYLSGYIAFVIKRNGGPILGTSTRKRTSPISSVTTNSPISVSDLWIHTISRGGLIYPEDNLVDQVEKCEEIFNSKFPRDEVIGKPGISTIITNDILKGFPNLNPLVIRQFVKTRLQIRIRHLNSEKKAATKSRRNFKKYKQFSKCQ